MIHSRGELFCFGTAVAVYLGKCIKMRGGLCPVLSLLLPQLLQQHLCRALHLRAVITALTAQVAAQRYRLCQAGQHQTMKQRLAIARRPIRRRQAITIHQAQAILRVQRITQPIHMAHQIHTQAQCLHLMLMPLTAQGQSATPMKAVM